jgi:hypothetical protein
MDSNQEVVYIRTVKKRMSKYDSRIIIVGYEACDKDGRCIESSESLEVLKQKYSQANDTTIRFI